MKSLEGILTGEQPEQEPEKTPAQLDEVEISKALKSEYTVARNIVFHRPKGYKQLLKATKARSEALLKEYKSRHGDIPFYVGEWPHVEYTRFLAELDRNIRAGKLKKFGIAAALVAGSVLGYCANSGHEIKTEYRDREIIKEVPVTKEVTVQKAVYVDRPIEKIVEKEVEKKVYVDRPVTEYKVIEVPGMTRKDNLNDKAYDAVFNHYKKKEEDIIAKYRYKDSDMMWKLLNENDEQRDKALSTVYK